MAGLREKQSKFMFMLTDFLDWAGHNGYEFTLGEAYRSDEQAIIHSLGRDGRAKLCVLLMANGYLDLARAIANNVGSGIKNSLHTKKLAIDLNVFKDGKYLSNTEDLIPLGEYWESIGGTWGGRFRDGNHFSLEHEGVK